jgi:hypothetical protein
VVATVGRELAAIEPVPSAVPRRQERDLLEEILTIVRQLSRDTPHQLPIGPLTAIARARASSGRFTTLQEALESTLDKALENQISAAAHEARLKLLGELESDAEAAARGERLNRLRQPESKKDKKE